MNAGAVQRRSTTLLSWVTPGAGHRASSPLLAPRRVEHLRVNGPRVDPRVEGAGASSPALPRPRRHRRLAFCDAVSSGQSTRGRAQESRFGRFVPRTRAECRQWATTYPSPSSARPAASALHHAPDDHGGARRRTPARLQHGLVHAAGSTTSLRPPPTSATTKTRRTGRRAPRRRPSSSTSAARRCWAWAVGLVEELAPSWRLRRGQHGTTARASCSTRSRRQPAPSSARPGAPRRRRVPALLLRGLRGAPPCPRRTAPPPLLSPAAASRSLRRRAPLRGSSSAARTPAPSLRGLAPSSKPSTAQSPPAASQARNPAQFGAHPARTPATLHRRRVQLDLDFCGSTGRWRPYGAQCAELDVEDVPHNRHDALRTVARPGGTLLPLHRHHLHHHLLHHLHLHLPSFSSTTSTHISSSLLRLTTARQAQVLGGGALRRRPPPARRRGLMAVQYGFPERLCEPMQVTAATATTSSTSSSQPPPPPPHHLLLLPAGGGGGELGARGAARRVASYAASSSRLWRRGARLSMGRRTCGRRRAERRSRRGLGCTRHAPAPAPPPQPPPRPASDPRVRPPPRVDPASCPPFRRARARLVPDRARHLADALAEPHAALLPPPLPPGLRPGPVAGRRRRQQEHRRRQAAGDEPVLRQRRDGPWRRVPSPLVPRETPSPPA